MDTKAGTKCTVILTNRRPVTIVESDWPVVAKASGDSFAGSDGGRHRQALAQGECDKYSLRVRQHADGRAIVFGALEAATARAGSEDHRGGVLLPAGANIAVAILWVGKECGIPDRVIRECIANLPAEDLT